MPSISKKSLFCLILMPIAIIICQPIPAENRGTEISDLVSPGRQEIAITQFSFGSMEVNDISYQERDLLILPDGTITRWDIFQDHNIGIVDIKAYINDTTQIVIIGTGVIGNAKVHPDTKAYLKAKRIKLSVFKTSLAAELFNKMPKANMVAFFHLNC